MHSQLVERARPNVGFDSLPRYYQGYSEASERVSLFMQLIRKVVVQWVSRLTSKQEKYVQGLVAGLTQRQAYLKAYPNSNKWKPETVDNKASALLRNDEVLARYNELMDEHKAKALWTREEAVNTLKWLYKQAIKSIKEQDEGYVRQGTSSALLGAIQELNKLEDLYPSDKHQVEHIGQVSFIDDIS